MPGPLALDAPGAAVDVQPGPARDAVGRCRGSSEFRPSFSLTGQFGLILMFPAGPLWTLSQTPSPGDSPHATRSCTRRRCPTRNAAPDLVRRTDEPGQEGRQAEGPVAPGLEQTR